jgi:hypothetical protein
MRSCLSGSECQPKPNEIPELRHSSMFLYRPKCGSDIAYAYFCSFIFLCSFLMLNLFVAVIMDNFDYLTRDSSILGAHHLDEYIRAWADIDPTGTGKVNYKEVYKLLLNMEPPVGFGKKCPKVLAYRRLIRMNMPVADDGSVHFTTTLFALIRESLVIKPRSNDENDKADDELKETIKKLWPIQSVKKLNLLVPNRDEIHGTSQKRRMTVGKIYAALLILENYRLRKTLMEGGEARPKSSFFTRLMNAVHQNQQTAASQDDQKSSQIKTSASNSVISKNLMPSQVPYSLSQGMLANGALQKNECISSIVLNMNGSIQRSEPHQTSANNLNSLKYRPIIRTAESSGNKKRSVEENHFIQNARQQIQPRDPYRLSVKKSRSIKSRKNSGEKSGTFLDMPSVVSGIIDSWEAEMSREIRRKPSGRYDSSKPLGKANLKQQHKKTEAILVLFLKRSIQCWLQRCHLIRFLRAEASLVQFSGIIPF